ncbi:MAG: hypothetical protein QXQ46_06530, partial [Thermoplasmatales archaeon]
VIEDEKSASRLRNRGFKGRDIGKKLSLSLPVSYYLVRSGRLEVLRGTKKVEGEELFNVMDEDKKRMANAYLFLRLGGKNPYFYGGKLRWNRIPIEVCGEGERVQFKKFGKRTYLCITYEDGCLLYLSEIFLYKKQGNESLKNVLQDSGYRVETGIKYGCDYRLYEKSPHASFLVTLDDEPLARDLVGRIRIAHSVRKTYVHAAKKDGSLILYKFRWIR